MADSTTHAARPRLAVVTGASSGIGTEFAERLARDGYDLLLVARRRDRLESLAGKISDAHSVRVDVASVDLADTVALRELEARLAADADLDMLVNCAGFGTISRFVEMDADRAEREVLVNVVALVRLTRAVLPAMIERRGGSVVNVASMAAFQPNPFYATYGASKAYVTSFTEALSEELRGTGVRVVAVCPGPVPTEFGDVAGLGEGRFPSFVYTSVNTVVDDTLRDLRRGRVVCVPGNAGAATGLVLSMLPRWASRRLGYELSRRMFGRSSGD